MKIQHITEIHDWNDPNEGQIFDPKELIRQQLNTISHEVFVLREQLGNICRQHMIESGSIRNNTEINPRYDCDYSCFDTQGVDKRVVLYVGKANVSEEVQKNIKRIIKKLTNLYIQQQKLFEQLRKQGDESAGYKHETGWSFKPVQQK